MLTTCLCSLDLSSLLQERFSLSSGSVESESGQQPSCMVSGEGVSKIMLSIWYQDFFLYFFLYSGGSE